jgi:hypothetical protein
VSKGKVKIRWPAPNAKDKSEANVAERGRMISGQTRLSAMYLFVRVCYLARLVDEVVKRLNRGEDLRASTHSLVSTSHNKEAKNVGWSVDSACCE